MKETIKASIAGYAFTLDTDAYGILKDYLSSLNKHFSATSDKDEIMDDIEVRMSELLQIKCSKEDHIITSPDAIDIIKIMGSPIDIAEDNISETYEEKNTERKKEKKTIKKFYRDTDNAVIGGVCGGMGHYFNIDPVIIRVILVILVLFGSPFLGKIIGFIIILYITLWIVTPKAVTFSQKLSMLRDDSSIETIQSGSIKSPRRGSKLGKIILRSLQILCSTICYLISITIIISGFIVLLFPQSTKLPSVNQLLDIMGLDYSGLDISILFAWFIPALILMYLGIRIFFRMNVRDLVIIGISTGIWIMSALYVTLVTVNEVQYYQYKDSITDCIDIESKSDTLYLRLEDQLKNASDVSSDKRLFKSKSDATWYLIPEIYTVEDDSIKDFKIEIKTIAFSKTDFTAQEKIDKAKYTIDVKDSLVTISPLIFNKTNKWNRSLYTITIYKPKSKVIKKDLILNRQRKSEISL